MKRAINNISWASSLPARYARCTSVYTFNPLLHKGGLPEPPGFFTHIFRSVFKVNASRYQWRRQGLEDGGQAWAYFVFLPSLVTDGSRGYPQQKLNGFARISQTVLARMEGQLPSFAPRGDATAKNHIEIVQSDV